MDIRAEESENLVFNEVQTKQSCTKLRVREDKNVEVPLKKLATKPFFLSGRVVWAVKTSDFRLAGRRSSKR